MHNALLVHDDIEDASDERRGTPTLHALHGIPLALNAGDAMGLLSLRPLKDNMHRLGLATGLRIFEETERMAWETTEGQALELGWQRENRTDVSDEDYLRMVLQKTCWLGTIHPLRVGCLIGARGRLPLDPLIRLGFFFGAAFQIQDDLLNLEPGPAYGKEVNGDLLEGKRTLMIIHALRTATKRERAALTAFLRQPRASRSAARVAWVRALLHRCGAIEPARTIARALGGAALYEFDSYFATVSDSRDLRFMRGLLTWVLRRTH
jgi:geranylgeranyl diphosphate synthase type II